MSLREQVTILPSILLPVSYTEVIPRTRGRDISIVVTRWDVSIAG
jgi:hypothetical protein